MGVLHSGVMVGMDEGTEVTITEVGAHATSTSAASDKATEVFIMNSFAHLNDTGRNSVPSLWHLFEFVFQRLYNLCQRLFDIAIRQAALRQVGASAAAPADEADKVARLQPFLDEVLGQHRHDV